MALMGDRNTQRLLDQKKRAEVRLIEQVRNAAKPGMPVFPPPVRLPNHEQDAMGDRIVSLFGSLPQKSHSTSNLMLESPQCETMEDFEVREAQRRMKERDQQKRISSSSTNRTSQDYDRNSAHSNGFGGNLQERGDRRPSEKISNGHGMSNGHASRQKSENPLHSSSIAPSSSSKQPRPDLEKPSISTLEGPSDMILEQIIREMKDMGSTCFISPVNSPAPAPPSPPPAPSANSSKAELLEQLAVSDSEDESSSSSLDEEEKEDSSMAPPVATMPSDTSQTDDLDSILVATLNQNPPADSDDEPGLINWGLGQFLEEVSVVKPVSPCPKVMATTRVEGNSLMDKSDSSSRDSTFTASPLQASSRKKSKKRESSERISMESTGTEAQSKMSPAPGMDDDDRQPDLTSLASLSPLPSQEEFVEKVSSASVLHIQLPSRSKRRKPADRTHFTVQFALDLIDRLPSSPSKFKPQNISPVQETAQVAPVTKHKKSASARNEQRARRQESELSEPILSKNLKNEKALASAATSKSPLLDLDSASSVTGSPESSRKTSLKLRLSVKKKSLPSITISHLQDDSLEDLLVGSTPPVPGLTTTSTLGHSKKYHGLQKADNKVKDEERIMEEEDNSRWNEKTKTEKKSRKDSLATEGRNISTEKDILAVITGPPISPLSMSPTPVSKSISRSKKQISADLFDDDISQVSSKKRPSSADSSKDDAKKIKSSVSEKASKIGNKNEEKTTTQPDSSPPKRRDTNDKGATIKKSKQSQETEQSSRKISKEDKSTFSTSSASEVGRSEKKKRKVEDGTALVDSKESLSIVQPRRTGTASGSVLDRILTGGKNPKDTSKPLTNGSARMETEAPAVFPLTNLAKVTPPTGYPAGKSAEDLWNNTRANLAPLDSKMEFEHQRTLAKGFKREAERIDRPGTRFAVYLQSVVHFALMARSVELLRQRGVSDLYLSTITMMDTSKRSLQQQEPVTLLDKVARYLYYCAHALLDVKVYSLNEEKCLKLGRHCEYLKKHPPLVASTTTPSSSGTLLGASSSSAKPPPANGKSPSPGTSASPYSVGSTGSHGSGEKSTATASSSDPVTQDSQSREASSALHQALLDHHQLSQLLTISFNHWTRSRALVDNEPDPLMKQFQSWLQSKAPLHFTSSIEDLALHLYYALWVLRALRDSS